MKKKDNVIDMTERIKEPNYKEYLKSLKVRFDLEHTKVALSTSLLSIVVLVTLANNNLMTTSIEPKEEPMRISRGIASVSGESATFASTQSFAGTENPQLLKELAKRDLSPNASVGRKPSALEKLAFEVLEGKYAVRLRDGIIDEIELAEGGVTDAKEIQSLQAFINGQRDLLPRYDRLVKVGSEREGMNQIETYQLVNEVSIPVAKVEVRLGDSGRLMGMRVAQLQAGAN